MSEDTKPEKPEEKPEEQKLTLRILHTFTDSLSSALRGILAEKVNQTPEEQETYNITVDAPPLSQREGQRLADEIARILRERKEREEGKE